MAAAHGVRARLVARARRGCGGYGAAPRPRRGPGAYGAQSPDAGARRRSAHLDERPDVDPPAGQVHTRPGRLAPRCCRPRSAGVHTSPGRTVMPTSTRPDGVLTSTAQGNAGSWAAVRTGAWPGSTCRTTVPFTTSETGRVVPLLIPRSICAGGTTTAPGGGVGPAGAADGSSEQPETVTHSTAAMASADGASHRSARSARGPRMTRGARPRTPSVLSRRRYGSAPAGTARRSTWTGRTCRWSRSPSSRRRPARPATHRWSRLPAG